MKFTLADLARVILPKVSPGDFFSANEKRTLIAAADVLLDGCPVELTSAEAIQNVEDFLLLGQSQRAWRLRLLAEMVDYAPLVLQGKRRFSRLSREQRKKLIEEKFMHGRYIWGICGKVRQLVYLGAYGDKRAEKATGFVPWQERPRFKNPKTRERTPITRTPTSPTLHEVKLVEPEEISV